MQEHKQSSAGGNLVDWEPVAGDACLRNGKNKSAFCGSVPSTGQSCPNMNRHMRSAATLLGPIYEAADD